MGKLMLLGARKFIDMPKGTFYISFWLNSIKECVDIVNKFNSNPLELLDFQSLHIYGNNSGSMCFSKEEEDFIFYYDANVVGDACPETTLYLVLDDSFIPETAQYTEDIKGFNYNNNTNIHEDGLILGREQVFSIRKEFLKEFNNLDNISDESNSWARDYLEKKVNKSIIDLCIEQII